MATKYCILCTHPGSRKSEPCFSIKMAHFNNDGSIAEFKDFRLQDSLPDRLIFEVEQMLHDLKTADKIYMPSDAAGYPVTDELPF